MSGVTSWRHTPTARDASLTYTTGPSYCGSIFTAVCAGDVVAPPMSSGTVKPRRCISPAMYVISSSDGVIDDGEVVALEHDADDVLADVVHVAFDRREHDGAIGLLHAVRERLDER